ncbi:TIGR01244 family phosphatase [Sulfitobacter sp. SK012]|uniref:TIGR01244 family sulfur transferase n=1 Tax=Sulfitobacter sp. SK012 TaxID=1389005 RepID=UPI000E0B7B08|nr:TIGR01244 family sulfur transferase [Sulfitobacter sp. SK012]AXI47071.1 TIGR01244 family phosphatase [Sulfitobacter sp. SK012]
MDIRQLTPRYFVAPQIDPTWMEALKERGFTRILCNRPDTEVPLAFEANAMETAAVQAGLEFVVQPLTHQNMTPEVIAQNRALGADTDGVVLAYCASGTRSCIAWALGQAGELSADDILDAARNGGYDLEQMRAYLENASSD